jgi:hypothetical protein
MSDKIFLPTSIPGKSPNLVTFDIPILEGYGTLEIGVESYTGRYYPIYPLVDIIQYTAISQVANNQVSSHFAVGLGQATVDVNILNATVNNNYGNAAEIPKVGNIKIIDNQKVQIEFIKTMKFNDSPLIINTSNSIINPPNEIIIQGGESPNTIPNYITDSDKELYNSILEDIAIELKISYR